MRANREHFYYLQNEIIMQNERDKIAHIMFDRKCRWCVRANG